MVTEGGAVKHNEAGKLGAENGMKKAFLDKEHIGKDLLSALREEGHFVSADCGGNGKCGKCKVRIIAGEAGSSDAGAASGLTEAERQALSEKEIEQGWRLACRAILMSPAMIEIPGGAEEQIVAGTEFLGSLGAARQVNQAREISERGVQDGSGLDENLSGKRNGSAPKLPIRIAVDIGTTTIAAALLQRERWAGGDNRGALLQRELRAGVASQSSDRSSVLCEKVAACVNHQRSFGADVISRIDASNKGNGEKLQSLVLKDLEDLAIKLGVEAEAFADPERVQFVISANTTMQHLLQGLSCETLGVAPYAPVDISLHKYRNMVMLPGITTFVGADIVSGIVSSGMDLSDGICLLVDLGTNGEMVIGNKDKLLCASTAAGPAFEGGNISCGVAGIPGAISSVEIADGQTRIRTLGNKPPIGICGTGVLETVYELYKNEIIDDTGLMGDEYFDEGFLLQDGIVFTAQDVREVQLAKSAIRAGLEVLLKEYGAGYGDVARIYLAGGFGEKIDRDKAIGIGILPEEFRGKIEAIGNSSLAGAMMYASDPSLSERFQRAAETAQEVALAENRLFNELYMEYMMFE